MKVFKQCIILVGGLGTRLGQLTAESPKPLLDCGGRPYLAWVLRELCRFGVEEVILLAGYKSDRVEDFCQTINARLPKPLSIKISVEPELAGTGGALWHAREHLADEFLLINGDSWFDTNLVEFLTFAAARPPDAVGAILAREVDDCARYGTVTLGKGLITGFREKKGIAERGLINAGIYVFDRRVLDYLEPHCSLEQAVMPALSVQGKLSGKLMQGYFIDIGIPEDYARAQIELPQRLLRPAVIFDRDGVLNEDLGWVGSKENFRWIEGAKEAVQLANRFGYHVFVVTNQAGVARGFYDEEAVDVLHRYMREELCQVGALVDDIRYCPSHPEAKIEKYRVASCWRKPEPGMILDLAEKWEADLGNSLLIGDKETDIAAGRAAGVASHLYSGGNLYNFLQSKLEGAPRGPKPGESGLRMRSI